MVLIHDDKNYWFNVKKQINSNSEISFSNLTQYEQIENQNLSFSSNGCGQTKGCLFWPQWCRSKDDCVYSFAFRNYFLYVEFEVFAFFDEKSPNNFIQIRFMNANGYRKFEVS